MPGHEKYQNRLVIPYITRAGIVSLRFRDISGDKAAAKYLGLPGDELRIFNPAALHLPGREIYVTEGEIDCITATQAGLPTVGMPGVSAFKPYMKRIFEGYASVFILADNDDKGQGADFAERLSDILPNPRTLLMPKGHDVNSLVQEGGIEALLAHVGKGT